jgi:hypothetical protein
MMMFAMDVFVLFLPGPTNHFRPAVQTADAMEVEHFQTPCASGWQNCSFVCG